MYVILHFMQVYHNFKTIYSKSMLRNKLSKINDPGNDEKKLQSVSVSLPAPMMLFASWLYYHDHQNVRLISCDQLSD